MELRTIGVSKRKKKSQLDYTMMLMGLGDIQYDGDPTHVALNRLREDIAFGLLHGCRFFGMGDYIDFMSPKNRARFAAAGLYDNTLAVAEEAAFRLLDQLWQILKPTRGHWVGLLEGHHFYKTNDGLTTDMHLAEMLGTEFLGTTALVQFNAGDKEEDQLEVWGAHGTGSGMLAGSLFNRIERIQKWVDGADLYLMGHWTKRGAVPLAKLKRLMKTDDLTHTAPLLIGTGGYARGYIENHKDGLVPRGTYVEKALYSPVALGAVPIFWEAGKKPPRALV